MSQVSKWLEVVYINGAPSTPGYLLALLRELSHVPRGLSEIAEAKQVRKTNQSGILYQSKKMVEKSILTFNLKSRWFLFRGVQVHPLRVDLNLKGGPEPLENEINKILGSKRDDWFSDHFSDLVQNICSVRFSYLLRLSIFCKAPRDMRKFPQECQKIAGCWESVVYGSRPPIASKPDSSPPERPGLDHNTSQPWSEATCHCTTSASAYLRFVTIFLLEKTRQSTRSGDTGASCVRPWLTREIV